MYEYLAIMAACVFLYSIASGGLERTPVNGALVFILCGIALGKAVVANESVPANIREGLNVESEMNDGICVPILFVFLALACWRS